MTTPQNVPRRRYGLFILAILLLLLGGAAIYAGSHNYEIRALGIVAVMASVYVVRISRVRERSDLPITGDRPISSKTTKGPGRLLWIASLSLLLMLGVALYLLHIDALNGGHEAWPADLFAGVGLACAIVWGFLVVKILGGSAGKRW